MKQLSYPFQKYSWINMNVKLYLQLISFTKCHVFWVILTLWTKILWAENRFTKMNLISRNYNSLLPFWRAPTMAKSAVYVGSSLGVEPQPHLSLSPSLSLSLAFLESGRHIRQHGKSQFEKLPAVPMWWTDSRLFFIFHAHPYLLIMKVACRTRHKLWNHKERKWEK